MKTLALLLFVALASASSFADNATNQLPTIAVCPALPGSSFADTEVSTNIAFSAGDGMRRIRLAVDMTASPSNNVEVAIGRDADNDGRLSLAESALTVGYDCGEWFVRSAEKDSHSAVGVEDIGRFCRAYEVRARHIDRSWNLVKVTRRDTAAADESVVAELTETGFGLSVR